MLKIIQSFCRFYPKRPLKCNNFSDISKALCASKIISARQTFLQQYSSESNQQQPLQTEGDKNDPHISSAAESEFFGGVNIQAISEGDAEIEKTLKVLILEVDMFRQDGHLVPDVMTEDHWREILTLPSRSARLRYLTYLFKTERKDFNKRRKAEERKAVTADKKKERLETDHISYGFGGSTIFLRIYDSTMDMYMNKNLINAAQFSQPLIVDCSYDDYMTTMEARNCAKQLTAMFAENRSHQQPFHLQYCNADYSSIAMKSFARYVPPMFEDYFPLFISEKSYLDLYPKEKLVYLTPHCKTDLVEWNHDDIYIIGAMVDKTNPKPLSLAKAKEQGLRMAKLPLERHLVWGTGASKNLTLNQMICICLDIRHTGNWETAFRHIPKRKIVSETELIEEARERKLRNMQMRRAPPGRGDVYLSERMIKRVQPLKIDLSKIYD